MREKIVIRLPQTPDQPVRWVHQPAGEESPGPEQTGTLEAVAAVAAGAHVTLLAPAAETVLTQARLPALKASRLQQIVGYALEESLSEEISRVHFAVGARNADGSVPVAVVGRHFMDDWRETIRATGLRPHEMLPEVLSLPLAENEWTLLMEGDQGLLRTGTTQGFACDLAQFEALLALAWEQTDATLRPAVLRVYPFGAPLESLQRPGALPPALTLAIEATDTLNSPLQLMIRDADAVPVMNLLSGDYSLHREYRKLWLPWREAAILVGVLMGVHLLYSVVQLHQFERLEARIREQQHILFRETLPDIATIRFPRRQMEAQLQERLKNQTVRAQDFIEFFAPLAGLIDTPSVEVQSVNYRSGTLDANLFTPDLSSLESIKTRFDQLETLEVELRSVVTGSNRAEGTIRLRRRA